MVKTTKKTSRHNKSCQGKPQGDQAQRSSQLCPQPSSALQKAHHRKFQRQHELPLDLCLNVYMYVHMYTSMYIYICIHTQHGWKRGTICGVEGKQHREEEDEGVP